MLQLYPKISLNSHVVLKIILPFCMAIYLSTRGGVSRAKESTPCHPFGFHSEQWSPANPILCFVDFNAQSQIKAFVNRTPPSFTILVSLHDAPRYYSFRVLQLYLFRCIFVKYPESTKAGLPEKTPTGITATTTNTTVLQVNFDK